MLARLRMRLQGLSGIELTSDGARCSLCVPASEPLFAGHFPTYPLVPGVVLIEAAVQLAAAWAQRKSRLGAIHEARFYDEVRPDDTVVVWLKRQGVGFTGGVLRGDKVCATMSFTIEDAPASRAGEAVA